MAKTLLKNTRFLTPYKAPWAPAAELWKMLINYIFKKNFSKIQLTFALLLISTFSQAQSSIVLTSYTHENTIYLRWAPGDVNLFEQALNKGYSLEKVDISSIPDFDISKFESSKREFFTFYPLAKKVDSLEKIKSPELKKYLLVQPFTSKKGDLKSKKMAFAYSLLNAGYDREIATNYQLSYKEIKKSKFAYRISISGTNFKSEIIIADVNLNSTNKTISSLNIEEYQKSAILSWEAKSIESDFSAYQIERSNDGNNFTRITKLPFLFLSSQYEKNKTLCTFSDTTVEYGKKYFYRIQGINHFALETSLSPMAEIKIKVEFHPIIKIDTIRTKQKSKIIVPELKFNNEKEKNNCFSVLLLASNKPTKDFKIIQESKLFSFQGFNFIDTVTRNFTHYKIGAVSIDKDTILSDSYYFFFNDSIPPKIPVELTGAISKTGVVTIRWKTNTEKDLKGYKVFYCNSLTEQFVEKTKQFCTVNTYIDTISLNNLDSVIYYRVVAVDSNYNHSKPSLPIKLSKPDKIAPVAPVFVKLSANNKGIQVKWNNSTSADLKSTNLYRIENLKETIIKTYLRQDTTTIFLDTTIRPQVNYQYKLEAIDRNGNSSFSKSSYQVFEPGFRKEIKNFNAKANIEKKQIELSWNVPTEPVFSYRIYRSKNEVPFILLKTIDAKNSWYTDKELNQNNTYSYKIQAVLVSGTHTQMSLPVNVVY